LPHALLEKTGKMLRVFEAQFIGHLVDGFVPVEYLSLATSISFACIYSAPGGPVSFFTRSLK
jgi:hypothetical protein